MAGIYRRSLGRIGRQQSEISEIRTTPADELSSWLGDDVCTNCGGPTAHGKLFCSDACKIADADQVAKASLVESMVPPARMIESRTKSEDLEKFRYHCPPSPSILAQMSAPLRATHLTSPALAAYQSSLPASRGRLPMAPNSNTQHDSRAVSPSHHTKKRSSSQSTFSSISESNGSQSAFADSTDPSTPSPAYGPIEDESSDLDAQDFQLPPSISTATSVMIRKDSKQSSKEATSPRSQATAPRSISKTEARTPKSPLWYARRPSTTNTRGSWYVSPAITAATIVTATSQDLRAVGSSSSTVGPRSRSKDVDATLTRKAAKDILSGALRSPSRPKAEASSVSNSNGVLVRRGNSDSVGTRSPQPVQSVASSASRTMRGGSPSSSSRAFSPRSNELGCDRCRTLSNISGEHNIYASSFVSAQPRGISASPRDVEERSRSLKQYHRHSHSASAGLYFTQMHKREMEQEASVTERAAVHPANAFSENITETSSPSTSALREQPAEAKATPPRGRSKVRGRSSHRRSPSPPRAAARRESSLLDEQAIASDPVSPPSHPISISMEGRSSRRASDMDSYHHDEELRSALPQRPSPLALISEKGIESIEEISLQETRGRSRGRSTRREQNSRERGPASRSRSRWVDKDCEVSWPAYGHRESDRGEVATTVVALPPRRSLRTRGRSGNGYVDPGFDDIELELDGDDEREESSGGSFDSVPARGRTMLRA